jgi:hypothetical protein
MFLDINTIILILFLILILINIPESNNFNCKIQEYFNNEIKKPYLWSYWQNKPNKQMPDYIKLCFETFKKHCSDNYEIVILDETSIYKYLPNLRKDLDELSSLAQKTDYIRIALLYNYGGLWLDADTIVMNDLHEIIDKLNEGYDYIGFGCSYETCLNSGYPQPSNGAMASQKHSVLMKSCLDDLDNILNNNKKFNYFDLGKITIWRNIEKLLQDKYIYYHFPSYADGSRDNNGKWINVVNHLSKDKTKFIDESKLMFVFLENNKLNGDNTDYNWFGKQNESFIKTCDLWICELFKKALKN